MSGRSSRPTSTWRKIDIPTLVIVGDTDVRTIEEVADLLATRIPGARKVLIEGADHVVNLRRPEAFDAAVVPFLHGGSPLVGRALIGAGALLGFLGVAAGAFGAHAIRERVTPERVDNWKTAADYQLWHALATIASGLDRGPVGERFRGSRRVVLRRRRRRLQRQPVRLGADGPSQARRHHADRGRVVPRWLGAPGRRRAPRLTCLPFAQHRSGSGVDPQAAVPHRRFGVVAFGATRDRETRVAEHLLGRTFARLFVEHSDDQSVAPREQVRDEVSTPGGWRVLEARPDVGESPRRLPCPAFPIQIRSAHRGSRSRANATSSGEMSRPYGSTWYVVPPRECLHQVAVRAADVEERAVAVDRVGDHSSRDRSQLAASPVLPEPPGGLGGEVCGHHKIRHRSMPAVLVDLAALELRVDRRDLPPRPLLEGRVGIVAHRYFFWASFAGSLVLLDHLEARFWGISS